MRLHIQTRRRLAAGVTFLLLLLPANLAAAAAPAGGTVPQPALLESLQIAGSYSQKDGQADLVRAVYTDADASLVTLQTWNLTAGGREELSVRNPNGTVVASLTYDLAAGHQLQAVPVKDLDLSVPGNYQFDIRLNGQPVAGTSLRAVDRKQGIATAHTLVQPGDGVITAEQLQTVADAAEQAAYPAVANLPFSRETLFSVVAFGDENAWKAALKAAGKSDAEIGAALGDGFATRGESILVDLDADGPAPAWAVRSLMGGALARAALARAMAPAENLPFPSWFPVGLQALALDRASSVGESPVWHNLITQMQVEAALKASADGSLKPLPETPAAGISTDAVTGQALMAVERLLALGGDSAVADYVAAVKGGMTPDAALTKVSGESPPEFSANLSQELAAQAAVPEQGFSFRLEVPAGFVGDLTVADGTTHHLGVLQQATPGSYLFTVGPDGWISVDHGVLHTSTQDLGYDHGQVWVVPHLTHDLAAKGTPTEGTLIFASDRGQHYLMLSGIGDHGEGFGPSPDGDAALGVRVSWISGLSGTDGPATPAATGTLTGALFADRADDAGTVTPLDHVDVLGLRLLHLVRTWELDGPATETVVLKDPHGNVVDQRTVTLPGSGRYDDVLPADMERPGTYRAEISLNGKLVRTLTLPVTDPIGAIYTDHFRIVAGDSGVNGTVLQQVAAVAESLAYPVNRRVTGVEFNRLQEVRVFSSNEAYVEGLKAAGWSAKTAANMGVYDDACTCGSIIDLPLTPTVLDQGIGPVLTREVFNAAVGRLGLFDVMPSWLLNGMSMVQEVAAAQSRSRSDADRLVSGWRQNLAQAALDGKLLPLLTSDTAEQFTRYNVAAQDYFAVTHLLARNPEGFPVYLQRLATEDPIAALQDLFGTTDQALSLETNQAIVGWALQPDRGANPAAARVRAPWQTVAPPVFKDDWTDPAAPGFYTTPPEADALARSLEYGNVVITYDPSRVSAADLDVLRGYATEMQGDRNGVEVVAQPDGVNAVVLTAWTHRLAQRSFDRQQANLFLTAFRGDAPEGLVAATGVDLRQVRELNGILRNAYNPPVGAQATESVLQAMMDAIGDRFSTYFAPADWKDFQSQISGQYGGVGIEVEPDAVTRGMKVTQVSNGPAREAGIQVGDVVITVDGKDIRGMTVDDAGSLVWGPVDSKVTLTVLRGGTQRDYTMTRAELDTPVVSGVILDQQAGVGYLRIDQFTDSAASQFAAVLKDLRRQGMNRLVLDLRWNPGGIVEQAVAIGSYFVPKGNPVMRTIDGLGDQHSYLSDGDTPWQTPLVVLVNENTASAAEILAGAIQDYKAGILVGTKTYGKGSVQETYSLGAGGAAKVTTMHWLTGAGHPVHLIGITPDRTVTPSPSHTNDDRQLQAAVDLVKGLNK